MKLVKRCINTKILDILVIVVFFLLFNTCLVQASSNSDMCASNIAPQDYQPSNSIGKMPLSANASLMTNDTNRVLLIQETFPWNSNANQVVLNSLNMSCTTITMAEFAQTNLTGYYLVIVANDQNLGFYSDYDNVKAKLENYVTGGGILVMGACDSGWAKGILTSGLPGNVQLAPVNYDYYNIVADSNHPIVTGELTDSLVLTNEDLYSNYCSHREFNEATLPVGSRIILRSYVTNNPTLVEYPLGKGKIIASGLTWEHNWIYHTGSDQYGTFGRKSLDDLFAYGASLSNPAAGYEFRRQVGIEFEQTSEPLIGAIPPQIEDITIKTIDEVSGKYRLMINRYTADMASGAKPFFFWKTYDGYFSDTNDDFSAVEFNANPGTAGEQLEITAFIGDNLGYLGSKTITVSGTEIQNEDSLDAGFVVQPNNLQGWDNYEIKYKATLYHGGKVVPGTATDIYFSADGTNWQLITSGLVNTNSYVWEVPNESLLGVRLRLVVQNGSFKKTIESNPFDILPSFYIEGKILDMNGKGVAGALVNITDSSVITDNTGAYLIRVAGAGVHEVKAIGDGMDFVKSGFTVLLDNTNFHDYKVFRVK